MRQIVSPEETGHLSKESGLVCRGTGAAFSPDARKPAEKAVPRVLLLILQRMESECQILSITASVSFFRSVRIWDVR